MLTSHEEQRFDAYYFVGDLKHVIDRYTELTGRPFMPPIYGLEMGDADCYLHSPRHGEIHTLDSLRSPTTTRKHDIPLGWMLVNDGYGCGYEFLDQVAAGLDARNMQLGLWTSTGLGSHAAEVRAGVRVRKLDIGWVGPGLPGGALSACEEAYQGMERCDTDIRGFVWLPEGWAGSPALRRALERRPEGQLGDRSAGRSRPTPGRRCRGRPTPPATSTGSSTAAPRPTCGTCSGSRSCPTGMAMNGWSVRHKRPWRDGEPFTSANRGWFQLRERLLPYQYTYAARGPPHRRRRRPPAGARVPRRPEDVGRGGEVRVPLRRGLPRRARLQRHDRPQRHLPPPGPVDGLLVGAGLHGPAHPQRLPAPPERLPLFVKGGSIIPMWPEGTLSWRTRDRSRLDLDVYPPADGPARSPSTRTTASAAATPGASTPSRPSPSRPTPTGITVGIGPSVGSYAGKVDSRRYRLTVHDLGPTTQVLAGGTVLARYDDPAAVRRRRHRLVPRPGPGRDHRHQAPAARRRGETVTVNLGPLTSDGDQRDAAR